MPSFAFWKSSKPEEANRLLSSDGAGADALRDPVAAAVRTFDLNPGSQDAGVFFFDEVDLPSPSLAAPSTLKPELSLETVADAVSLSSTETTDAVEELQIKSESLIPSVSPARDEDCLANLQASNNAGFSTPSSSTDSTSSDMVLDKHIVANPLSVGVDQVGRETSCVGISPPQSRSTFTPLEQAPSSECPSIRPALTAPEKLVANSPDGDSSDCPPSDHNLPPQSRPSPFALSDVVSHSQTSSLSLRHTSSRKSSPRLQRTDSTARRLRRPAEMNLGCSPVVDASKPRSELEMRYDLIRNSTTQSKAALRSPTQLLKERLHLLPKRNNHDVKIRVFTPPRSTTNGCWLPGPAAQMEAFTSTSVRARTEAGGHSAWWCKFDKLVVFDGIETQDNGELRIHTRTSKGLSIARRRGDLETIVIPMNCAHCQEMLNRHEWKYDMRVCKRSVCWDCRERCKWESEEKKKDSEIVVNRYRADSVLQDEHKTEEESRWKTNVEQM